MSYYWTPVCDTCGEEGPKIRSGHSGLKFGPDHVTSTEPLQQWLDDHEHHDVRLCGEGVRGIDAGSAAKSGASIDWNPQGPVEVSLRVATTPGTRQIIGNTGSKPLVIRESGNEGLQNSFVLPVGVDAVVVAPHSTAMFVAEKPSRWKRLWCRLTGRAPDLRWRHQPQDQEAHEVLEAAKEP